MEFAQDGTNEPTTRPDQLPRRRLMDPVPGDHSRVAWVMLEQIETNSCSWLGGRDRGGRWEVELEVEVEVEVTRLDMQLIFKIEANEQENKRTTCSLLLYIVRGILASVHPVILLLLLLLPYSKRCMFLCQHVYQTRDDECPASRLSHHDTTDKTHATHKFDVGGSDMANHQRPVSPLARRRERTLWTWTSIDGVNIKWNASNRLDLVDRHKSPSASTCCMRPGSMLFVAGGGMRCERTSPARMDQHQIRNLTPLTSGHLESIWCCGS